MKLLIAAALFMFSVVSFAQSKIVSVDAYDMAYSGGLAFSHDEGKEDDRDTTTFKFNLNYAQNLPQYVGLMGKAQAYWNRSDEDFGGNDTLSSEFGFGAGILYNFQADNIKNSIMAGIMFGVERATYEFAGSDDEAGFNLFMNLEAGKRWDLGSYAVANISYAPTISLNLKRYGGDIRDTYFTSSRDLRFNFLKFDILF
jgi:hypothetical protein